MLGEDQFGFRKSIGTREAILGLRLIVEGRLKKNKPTYLAFIDLEKAFDNVDWNIMFSLLKKLGFKYRDRRTIANMYRNQTATLTIEEHKKEALIRKGVRQGCSLSPLLFNLYMELAVNDVKEQFRFGVTVQGEKIKMLRFADDIVILAESKKDLEETMNGIDEVLRKKYRVKINKNKTKVMKCSRNNKDGLLNVKIGGEKIMEVEEFCYLGSRITKDGRSRSDIKCRIAQAKRAFSKKYNLFTSKINLNVRKRFLKVYVWSVALYGSENWTIGVSEKKRLEAFEMWCYRRMLKIRRVDKVTNEEVLRQIDEERSIWKNIVKRRDRLIGHILRHPGIVALILEGQVEGKNCVGRPRLEYVKQIVGDVGCRGYTEMKRLALDRESWRAASNQSNDWL